MDRPVSEDDVTTEKISREFSARLARRPPNEQFRAIVLLREAAETDSHGRRKSTAERKAAIAARRLVIEAAVPEIQAILKKYGGMQLPNQLDALGGLAVETTPAGIRALAACEHVRAILEDQPISLITRPSTA